MPWSKVVVRDAQNGTRVATYALRRVDEPVDLLEERIRVPYDDQGKRLSAIEEEAYRRGFEAGEAAGRAQGLKTVEENHAILLPLITEVKRLKEVVLCAAEDEIVKIALAAAKQVLRQEMQHPELLLEYIREAIRKIGQAQTLLIRVPEQDLERLTRERAQLIQLAEGVDWLKIESDRYLQPGECIVEANDRVIDSRLESQMAAIEKGLTECR